MMTNSEKKLLKVKTNLMRNHFGLASIMMSLEFIQDESINTMATDGRVLMYSEKFIEEHMKGKANHQYKLWSLLQFNQWYNNFYNN